jgi:hypothetical protein
MEDYKHSKLIDDMLVRRGTPREQDNLWRGDQILKGTNLVEHQIAEIDKDLSTIWNVEKGFID